MILKDPWRCAAENLKRAGDVTVFKNVIAKFHGSGFTISERPACDNVQSDVVGAIFENILLRFMSQSARYTETRNNFIRIW